MGKISKYFRRQSGPGGKHDVAPDFDEPVATSPARATVRRAHTANPPLSSIAVANASGRAKKLAAAPNARATRAQGRESNGRLDDKAPASSRATTAISMRRDPPVPISDDDNGSADSSHYQQMDDEGVLNQVQPQHAVVPQAVDGARQASGSGNRGSVGDGDTADGEVGALYQLHSSGSEESGDDEYDNDEDDEMEEEREISLSELMYGAASYHAIVKPVSLTMILAALSAVKINTELSIMQGEQALSQAYTVWKIDDSGSAGSTLAKSIGNAFVMVTVICAMTFVIVILYKYRCMKCLIGYMIFTSATLLGIMGSVMFDVAIERYELSVDVISYHLVLWNFAAVGTLSIFWQTGIPSYITQSYLVATSVILAWHLSHFDEWTAWTLLVMLALYDLCAVLTPYGPLKALVNEMQAEDAPDMPGLLYEAQLEGGRGAPGGRQLHPQAMESQRRPGLRGGNEDDTPHVHPIQWVTSGEEGIPGIPVANTSLTSQSTDLFESSSSDGNSSEDSSTEFREGQSTKVLPLAIAKLYKLPIISAPPGTLEAEGNYGTGTNSLPLLQDGQGPPGAAVYQGNYSAEQLRTEVRAGLPRNGGRIERLEGPTRFVVFDRRGVKKRTLVINRQGKVFELSDNDEDDFTDGEDDKISNTIRLGLGDFIFYSVMVAKAALYSFATFASCMLVILAGLGVTLVLLAVYRHALPALPVSIFLGVIFYLLTRVMIEPWVQDVLTTPLYV